MDLSNKISYEADAEIDEIILRLDLTLVRPDGEDVILDEDQTEGNNSASGTPIQNGGGRKSSYGADGKEDEKKKKKGGSGGGAMDFLRKLKSGSSDEQKRETSQNRLQKSIDMVKVDHLPQKFIAKYIGCKACRGLWGIKHTREPVDSLVEELRQIPVGQDLPLVRLEVSLSGVTVNVHPRTRARQPPADLGLMPLEFVSYAVQDNRYTRIFAFILVRELSSRARSTECHAFLSDSTATARKMALSVALAFRAYEQRLQGKPYKFAVDLRPPAELASDLRTSDASPAAAGPDFDV